MIYIAVGVCNNKGAIQNVMFTIFSANQVVVIVKNAKQCMEQQRCHLVSLKKFFHS